MKILLILIILVCSMSDIFANESSTDKTNRNYLKETFAFLNKRDRFNPGFQMTLVKNVILIRNLYEFELEQHHRKKSSIIKEFSSKYCKLRKAVPLVRKYNIPFVVTFRLGGSAARSTIEQLVIDEDNCN